VARGRLQPLAEKVDDVVRENGSIEGVYSLADLVAALEPPRTIWLMLTAGKPNDQVLFGEGGLVELLEPGDVVIDGGNSYYRDAAGRAERLAEHGIHFMDCGTSGGPAGARTGACLMIGGHEEDFGRLEALFADIALPDAYRFFEGHGAGHFVKMVHNGIEYGMMQAIAEGFQIMRMSEYELDLTAVADVYQHGSVIESRLVGWLGEAFELHGEALEGVSGMVGHTGEGEWTVRTADEMGLEARVIRGALEFRKESERDPSYAGQVLSALRNRFGGHAM
jgi:6-phosphogluconate dehydrogenase